MTSCLGQRKSSSLMLLLTEMHSQAALISSWGSLASFQASLCREQRGSSTGLSAGLNWCCSWMKEWETQSTWDRRDTQQGWAWEPWQSSRYQPEMPQPSRMHPAVGTAWLHQLLTVTQTPCWWSQISQIRRSENSQAQHSWSHCLLGKVYLPKPGIHLT